MDCSNLAELDAQIAAAPNMEAAIALLELREETAYELYKWNRKAYEIRPVRPTRVRGSSYHWRGDKCPE